MIKKKHFLATILAATALTTGAAQAGDCFASCNPCDTESCFGGFEVGAEFLYWKMCMDDLNYATSYPAPFNILGVDPFVANGTIESICVDWKPGVRFFLSKENIMGDWGLLFSYTWMNNHTSRSTKIAADGLLQETVGIRNDFLAPEGILGVQLAQGSYNMNYQTFDVLFGSEYCFKQGHNFQPSFGVTGLFLDQKFNSAWTKDDAEEVASGNTRWRDDFSGYGLKFGGEYSFIICDGFSMFANADGAITVGTHTAHYNQVKAFPPLVGEEEGIRNRASFSEHECTFVPGYHIGVGFEYESCLCDIEYALSIGYEFTEWRNVPNQRRFYSDDLNSFSTSSSSTIATLGYHGLFVGLKATF